MLSAVALFLPTRSQPFTRVVVGRLTCRESTTCRNDVTGPFYTLVLEVTVPNLATFESNAPRLFGDKEWQAHYQKMAPLVAARGVRAR
jgi:hypothetical protein